MSNQGTNADNRMIDMLGELIAHRGANLVIAFAVKSVGGSEALEIGDCFDIPNDHIAHTAHSTGWLSKSLCREGTSDSPRCPPARNGDNISGRTFDTD